MIEMTNVQKIYLREMIKQAENDHSFMVRLTTEIGTFGIERIREIRAMLETELKWLTEE